MHGLMMRTCHETRIKRLMIIIIIVIVIIINVYYKKFSKREI